MTFTLSVMILFVAVATVYHWCQILFLEWTKLERSVRKILENLVKIFKFKNTTISLKGFVVCGRASQTLFQQAFLV